jgi:hypothetical protein
MSLTHSKTGTLISGETSNVVGEPLEVSSFKTFSLMIVTTELIEGAHVLISGTVIPGGTYHPIHEVHVQGGGTSTVMWDDFSFSHIRAEVEEYVDGNFTVEYSLGRK